VTSWVRLVYRDCVERNPNLRGVSVAWAYRTYDEPYWVPNPERERLTELLWSADAIASALYCAFDRAVVSGPVACGVVGSGL